jgi:hypothetical protein
MTRPVRRRIPPGGPFAFPGRAAAALLLVLLLVLVLGRCRCAPGLRQ